MIYFFSLNIVDICVSTFSHIFRQSMNQEEILFKSQYILEKLCSTDPGFSYNISYDENNEVIGIVWVTSYIRDTFERFWTYLSVDIIYSSIYDAKELCYIAPVVKNEINKTCVVCEGFVIIETN